MVYTCSVPNCKGNYTNSPKLTVFSFPKNQISRRKWIDAINQDFVPTPSSRVCIQHFAENQIRRTKEVHRGKGKILLIHLQRPRLRVGAVPSIFENNSNNETSQRRFPSRRKQLRSDHNGDISIGEGELLNKYSLSPDSNKTPKTLQSFSDFVEYLVDCNFDDWHVIKSDGVVLFAIITMSGVPKISVSAAVDTNFKVKIYKGQNKIETLNGKKFPNKISSVDELKIILKDLSYKSSMYIDGPSVY